jgi:hypothetical protein
MPDPEPILGRMEAAALLAIDQANGGELSSLAQVLATFQQTFNRTADPEEFSEALSLLAEAGLIEYAHHDLGLAPKGRKFMRKSGAPWDPHRPQRLTALLEDLEEGDLAAPGTVPAPSEDDLRAALGEMTSDEQEGDPLVPGAELAPLAHSPMIFPGVPSLAPLTLTGGLRVTFEQLRNPDGPPDPDHATDAADAADAADASDEPGSYDAQDAPGDWAPPADP